MSSSVTLPNLQSYLDDWAGSDTERQAVAVTIKAIADASVKVCDLITLGPLAGSLAAVVGDNADGDAQKELDILANDIFIEGLQGSPVNIFGSEESDTVLRLNEKGTLAIAIDPLDGSSNIETNVSVGTIFSILPMASASGPSDEDAVLQPGRNQLAAGFVIFGPQTALVLTVRQGTHIFTLDPRSGQFHLTSEKVMIPSGKLEYAINASNYRHWDTPLRAYIDDCMSGDQGPHGDNFNMRWVASLVAETFRILVRGGIFLYPRDARPGYQNGRLRLLYEANPIALLIEEAGGGATEGEFNILDIEPSELHQRVPLIFGSLEKVKRVTNYHNDRTSLISKSPLFGRRGLFRS